MTPKILCIKSLELEVEKIMSIQEFAFQLSKKIQDQHSVKISRSHIYELIALDQDYKTYSSFVAQNLLLEAQYDDSEEYYQHELIDALTLEILKNPPETDYLNYSEDDLHWDDYEGNVLLEQIRKIIIRLKVLLKLDALEEFYLSISKTVYRELLWLNLEVINFNAVREELSYINFENGKVDDLELGGNYFEFSKIGAIFEKILSYAQDRENADAYALLGAYYRYLANQIAPYGRHGSNFGSRWDNNKQKYINSDETKKNKEKYEEIFKNHGEAWLYIYLAQMCGVDFTQDDFRAYNAYTGEDYDDYGPMEIAGREAIQYAIDLSELDVDKDNLARKIAAELFEKI